MTWLVVTDLHRCLKETSVVSIKFYSSKSLF